MFFALAHNDKVIIIGGGIAGKLAARVLSDQFKEVIIVERDSEPLGPVPRKGVPQGKHIHALLHAGEKGLEELFPGITETFQTTGAVQINSTKDLAWFHHGVWKLRYDGGYTTTLQTRPHLEWHIEQYIKDIENITVQYNLSVKNYIYEEDQNRIIGIEVQDNNQSLTSMYADLIVDASGASSLSNRRFKEMGVHIPSEKVNIDLTYVSQLVELPSKERDWTIKLIYPNPPQEKLAGSISKVEGNRYIVTFIGYHGVITDKEFLFKKGSLLELAEKLEKKDIFHELQQAKPVSEIALYKVPHISWKRMDKSKNLPKGLLLIGDTLCRIDPFFGQGMSIAVLEALALKNLLRDKTKTTQEVIHAFHKKAARIIAPIWNMVVTEDFRYPATSGKKIIGLAFLQWYSKHIFLLSSKNAKVYDKFINVMNLVRPMTILMNPTIIVRVIMRTIFK